MHSRRALWTYCSLYFHRYKSQMVSNVMRPTLLQQCYSSSLCFAKALHIEETTLRICTFNLYIMNPNVKILCILAAVFLLVGHMFISEHFSDKDAKIRQMEQSSNRNYNGKCFNFGWQNGSPMSPETICINEWLTIFSKNRVFRRGWH